MHTNRRGFIRVIGTGLVVYGVGVPLAAWAQRLRILGEGDMPEQPEPRRGGSSPELRQFLAALRVEATKAFEDLRVIWLVGAGSAGLGPVATLEEARAQKQLLLTERDQASVPEVIAENRGKIPALILAGEILVGGKQNRVLTEDVLLPPQSGPRRLAVYCVEQGRWSERSSAFEAQGSIAAPGLRAKAMDRAGQARVWAEVRDYAASVGASSPTQSYQAVHEKHEVRVHLDAAVGALDPATPAGALGAAAFVGRSLVGVDCFSDPGLFRREWPKLLRAYAVEAYRRPTEDAPDVAKLRGQIEALLRDAAAVKGEWRSTPGMGGLFEFRLEALRGSALVVEGGIVHVAIVQAAERAAALSAAQNNREIFLLARQDRVRVCHKLNQASWAARLIRAW